MFKILKITTAKILYDIQYNMQMVTAKTQHVLWPGGSVGWNIITYIEILWV